MCDISIIESWNEREQVGTTTPGNARAMVIAPTMPVRQAPAPKPAPVREAPRRADPWSISPADAEDLRRTHRREVVDHILETSQHLEQGDRALIAAIYGAGQSATDLARVFQEDARCVRRRVHRTVRRMLSPMFVFVTRRGPAWPPTRRRVAEAIFLHGKSMRQAARALGVTLHVVRRHCLAVQSMLEAEALMRRAG